MPRLLCTCLSASLLLSAQDPQPRFVADVHAAPPLGTLARDVNGQVGFGVSLGAELPTSARTAIRVAFSWTGYRVNNRNLAARALANLADASYDEDRLVLRSYAIGAELMIFQQAGGFGPYLCTGAGVQKARLYAEARFVDPDGHEHITPLATWPAADTPFLTVGMGYMGQAGAFIEGKLRNWRYRGVEGYALLDSPITTHTVLRDGVSLLVCAGVRF